MPNAPPKYSHILRAHAEITYDETFKIAKRYIKFDLTP